MLYMLIKDNVVQSNVHADSPADLPQGFVAVERALDGPAPIGYIWKGEALSAPPPIRSLVLKSVMVDRLHAAGLLEAARTALDGASLYDRERWNTRDSVYSDDPTTIALLTAIGADPAVILAP
jgi:hypothetical protein